MNTSTMPDRTKLNVGDRIRLVAVPLADLAQRARERAMGLPDAGWTADTIERILEEDPVLVINRIDDDGNPWFDHVLPGEAGPEEHSLALLDDDSWLPA